MRRSHLLGLVVSVLLAAPAFAQTVDEIVANNIEARGGLEKLKSVKSARMTGRMTVGPGIEAPVVIELKRPNKTRLDITFQGMTLTQAYDGKTGWQVNPFQGSKAVEPMSPEELRDAEEQADLDGPLVDWKSKGHKVELVGKEKVEGTDAWKLKVTLKNGNVQNIFLDADSFLDIRVEQKRTVRGTEIDSEQTIGDYKDIDGLITAHAFENGAKGQPEKQKLTLEKVELNVPIEDARFAMPPGSGAPAGTRPTSR